MNVKVITISRMNIYEINVSLTKSKFRWTAIGKNCNLFVLSTMPLSNMNAFLFYM